MPEALKTYFLAPNADCPPDNPNFIALGNIISSPAAVTRPLLPVDLSTRPVPHDLPSKRNGTWSKEKARANTVGVYAKFLELIVGVGVDAAVSYDKKETLDLSYKELKTQEISPSLEYITERIKQPEVQSYFNSPMTLRKVVYMVVGVKQVHGASMKRSVRKGKGLLVEAGADATSTTMVPVSFGAAFEPKKRHSEAASFAESDDFVFAYKLKRVEIKSRNRPPKITDYTSGAMLDGSGTKTGSDAGMTLEVTSVDTTGVEVIENGERVVVAMSKDRFDH